MKVLLWFKGFSYHCMTESAIIMSKKRSTPLSENPQGGKYTIYLLLAIILYVTGLYAGGLHGDLLTFDDNEYFENYPEVLSLSWESVKTYFTSYYVIMYQPLPVLTFAVNYALSGLNTVPMHWFNLFFHLGNVLLVFWFVKLLLKDTTVALLIAFIFGIHPMNVEAVTWISARSSSMYTFFYLLSMIWYLKYLAGFHTKNLVITTCFFLISLFCKAQAVTLPVVLLLLDYFSRRPLNTLRPWLEKAPLFVFSLIFGIVTLMNTSTMKNITEGMLIDYGPVDIFFLVCYSFVFYLMKLFLPVNLCAIYVFPPKDAGYLPWEYYASGVLMIGIIYLIWRHRSNRDILFGIGFFLATIAINIQIIPSRLFIVTERYGYLPYLGLFLLIAFLIKGFRVKNNFRFNQYLPAMIGMFILYSLFFSYAVVARNAIWKNDIVFLTDIIEKNPESSYLYRAYGNRGTALQRRGRYAEALPDFNEAIRLHPEDSKNFLNRALCYSFLQNDRAALADFDRAIQLDSTQSMLYNNRSQVRFKLSDFNGSEADCRKCIELDPGSVDAYNTLANIAYIRKRYSECDSLLSKAIALKPDFAIGYKNRGLLYIELGQKEKACQDFMTGGNLGNDEAKMLRQQHCK